MTQRFPNLNVDNHESNQPIGNMKLDMQRTSSFCCEQRMVLNVKNTNEIIFDFRVKKTTVKTINLRDLEIEQVFSFKLLGIWLDDDHKWNSNTDYIIKKACTFLKF